MAIQQNFTTTGFVKTGDNANQRGFAAARRSDDADKFAAMYVKGDVVEHHLRATIGAVGLFEIADF